MQSRKQSVTLTFPPLFQTLQVTWITIDTGSPNVWTASLWYYFCILIQKTWLVWLHCLSKMKGCVRITAAHPSSMESNWSQRCIPAQILSLVPVWNPELCTNVEDSFLPSLPC